MKIKILNAATRDLTDGFNFYEKQAEGLGNYFIDSIFSDIDSLQVYAGSHQKYFKRYYRLLAKRFPFAIYYRLVHDEIYVYAILDCRKKPAWIRKRVTT